MQGARYNSPTPPMSLLPVRLGHAGILPTTPLQRPTIPSLSTGTFTFPQLHTSKFPGNPNTGYNHVAVPSPRFPTIVAKGIQRKDNPKVRNRRFQQKFNGTSDKPRLSVFCSTKQLYAMLVDDQNKKTLFYASTLQKSIRGDNSCTTAEAAQKVGEEVVKACKELNISEISSYDRNGFARGERMAAFEIAISQHGFLPH